MAVNKKEFAYKMAEQGGIYKKDAVKAVNLFWEILMDYLSEGETVNFQGLGNFKIRTVKERKNARNPKTGEKCIIPEHQKVIFRPSELLADKIENRQ